MNTTFGFTFILVGFFCYFLACKIFVETNNYYRLISDDEKRRSNFQLLASIIAFLGFGFSGGGLMLINKWLSFNFDVHQIETYFGFLMFLFFQTLFIWFNIVTTKKYYHRESIFGRWVKKQNYEIEFGYYDISRFEYGNGVFKTAKFKNEEIYHFTYSVDYKKMTIKIKWKENYKEKNEEEKIPILVYFGDSVYKYKMNDKLLFLDDSIGYLERKY